MRVAVCQGRQDRQKVRVIKGKGLVFLRFTDLTGQRSLSVSPPHRVHWKSRLALGGEVVVLIEVRNHVKKESAPKVT